jgi:hypothetical protein
MPKSIVELSWSMLLGNQDLGISLMLLFARSVAEKKHPFNIIGNLEETAASFRSNPINIYILNDLYEKLNKDKVKLSRSFKNIRRCSYCQNWIYYSQTENCKKCGKLLDLPEITRLLLCADNLLWFFENRSETNKTDEFTEFICFLVVLEHDILFNQIIPGASQRQYAINLLSKITAVFDKNKGGVIDTSNPSSLKIYFVQDDMLDDTKTYTIFISNELQFFVKVMTAGIVI